MRCSGKWTKFGVIKVHSLKTKSNRLNNKPLRYNRVITLSQKQNSENAIWADVSVVIVTYNSAAVIESCLKPLLAAVKIIVVDNGSTDSTCTTVQHVSSDIEIIRNDKNIGFGAAINLGMAQVDTRYGFAINPDAITQPGALEHLIDVADKFPGSAIICPQIHNKKGDLEMPVMGPGEIHHQPMRQSVGGDFCTWFVTGAALLYRTVAWRDIGGYDETMFLYSEDNDLAIRMSKRGYSMIIAPAAEVIHSGGGSSKPSSHILWLKNWHMTWSHLYLTGKHVHENVARQEAKRMAVRYFLKATLYWVVFRWDKARRDGARFSACFTYLFKPFSVARQMGER